MVLRQYALRACDVTFQSFNHLCNFRRWTLSDFPRNPEDFRLEGFDAETAAMAAAGFAVQSYTALCGRPHNIIDAALQVGNKADYEGLTAMVIELPGDNCLHVRNRL